MEFKDPQAQAWYDSRPPVVQRLINQLPPQQQYSLQGDETGDYYEIYSYAENGTVSVVRYAGRDGRRSGFSAHGQEEFKYYRAGEPLWRVFGITPGELSPRTEGGN